MSETDSVSDTPELTPDTDDPFEIDEVYESLFDDLKPKQYESLKASIRKHGVDTAILIDAENKVIDGHHRLRAVRELRAEGHDIPDIPFVQKATRVDTLRARRANLARRGGHKKKGVQDYLIDHLPDVPEAADTDAEVMWPEESEVWSGRNVAEELGVSRNTVEDAIEDTGQVAEEGHLSIPSQREQKRDAVKSYIESNPDATDNEVVDAVDWDISRRTVNRWRNEWFDEESDEDDTDTEQSSLVGAGRDAEDSSEIAQDAADGEETATETLVEEGTATADSASDTRDKKQKEKEIEEDEKRREEQRESFKEAVKDNRAVEIHHGDFNDVLSGYENDSFDHIITDPPYHERHLHLYGEVAKASKRVVKPGGLVAAIAPHNFLPTVIEKMSKHLDWFWQWMMVQDKPTILQKKKIGIRYKPIVVFHVPPETELDKQAHDIITTGNREKDDHKWQQSLDTTAELVTDLTEPNDRICDPMAGSGTTGVAALQENRQVVLIDDDADALDTANKRLSEVIQDD
ncbi:adenine methyltransferase [environmental Halophage eHP-36]|nr:adenine methyltransferase [environmental Halophage eHP-36]